METRLLAITNGSDLLKGRNITLQGMDNFVARTGLVCWMTDMETF